MPKRVLLAQPRGFCAGVKRAIDIVLLALSRYGAPIYVHHEIVHNTTVVTALRQKGAHFVETIDDVPDNSVLIFSAHGVSRAVREKALSRPLTVIDATCPLVTKVHAEVNLMRQNNIDVVVIGHRHHIEVEGTLGQASSGLHLIENEEEIKNLPINPTKPVAYVTQTTLSVDDTQHVIEKLKQHFPKLILPMTPDICYATTNRQKAVRHIAQKATLVFVVGSKNSSNTNRLKETAQKVGAIAYRIDNAQEIDSAWLIGHETIGVTAGASAPESLVQEVLSYLAQNGYTNVETGPDEAETMAFALPKI